METKRGFLIFCLVANSAAAELDITPNHEKTTPPLNARYEIIQSQLSAKGTYKLDRACGNVYQMTKSSKDYLSWDEMPVFNLPKCTNDARPRYQLFISGLAARHSYLINTETGTTWVIVKIKTKSGDDETGWESIGG
jgi:hypothetical protein